MSLAAFGLRWYQPDVVLLTYLAPGRYLQSALLSRTVRFGFPLGGIFDGIDMFARCMVGFKVGARARRRIIKADYVID